MVDLLLFLAEFGFPLAVVPLELVFAVVVAAVSDVVVVVAAVTAVAVDPSVAADAVLVFSFYFVCLI